MSISGRGPQGERAVSADRLRLNEEDIAVARNGHFRVAIVLRKTQSAWARQVLGGLSAALAGCGAELLDIVDCHASAQIQNTALQRLARSAIDAVISVPIGNGDVTSGHRALAEAGKTLCLLDAAPQGLEPGKDYSAVVSADNFGLGEQAARLLTPHIPNHGMIGILTIEADFFATNEREIGFRKWIGAHRPDISLVRGRFADSSLAGKRYARLCTEQHLDGVFAAWDGPAVNIIATMHEIGRPLPMTCVDLGDAVAEDLLSGTIIKGVAAQRPFVLGRAAGVATIMSLIGQAPPRWVAVSGLEVTRDQVLASYQNVWHSPAPETLRQARRAEL